MNERQIQLEIFAAVGALPNVRIFRNNVGMGFVGAVQYEHHGIITLGNARRIRFGLHPGSADLIGWTTKLITQEMIGQRIAQFLSIETKAPNGRATDDQQNWRDQVYMAGGIACIVKSADEAVKTIQQ